MTVSRLVVFRAEKQRHDSEEEKEGEMHSSISLIRLKAASLQSLISVVMLSEISKEQEDSISMKHRSRVSRCANKIINFENMSDCLQTSL